ncbi:hypothetical protein AAF712_011076 [Marasmius tenuissimus]|uniref:BHLH domain-containing protein n=1 Tax=Marasmius tenuissimus TaxID=585030 RepID=A0ABR2ZK65_9AGAR
MGLNPRASPVDEESSPTSSASPITPISPSQEPITLPALPNATGLLPDTVLSTGKKRKASTAERRANHNAVERARRETLNDRFLDLAKIIPAISQHRKPSKSLIVNSSIAYVHASRRHRTLASRELKSLQTEADQLRQELNEWRDRAGVKRVEDPRRSEGFGMVVRAELPLESDAPNSSEENGDGEFYDEGEGISPVDIRPHIFIIHEVHLKRDSMKLQMPTFIIHIIPLLHIPSMPTIPPRRHVHLTRVTTPVISIIRSHLNGTAQIGDWRRSGQDGNHWTVPDS